MLLTVLSVIIYKIEKSTRFFYIIYFIFYILYFIYYMILYIITFNQYRIIRKKYELLYNMVYFYCIVCIIY